MGKRHLFRVQIAVLTLSGGQVGKQRRGILALERMIAHNQGTPGGQERLWPLGHLLKTLQVRVQDGHMFLAQRLEKVELTGDLDHCVMDGRSKGQQLGIHAVDNVEGGSSYALLGTPTKALLNAGYGSAFKDLNIQESLL